MARLNRPNFRDNSEAVITGDRRLTDTLENAALNFTLRRYWKLYYRI